MAATLPRRDDADPSAATRGLDLDLARQMLLLGEGDAADVGRRAVLVEAVHGRLRSLCAPVQDGDVDAMQATALGEPTAARAISTLLVRADAVLSYTEFLRHGRTTS